MNQDVKQKWIDALRGGNYQQCQTYLNKNHKQFCCLGVLTDLYIKETGKGQWKDRGDVAHSKAFVGANNTSESIGLHTEVMTWAGIDTSVARLPTPVVGVEGEFESNLMGCNDSGGLSFGEIADIIEKQF